MGYCPVSAGAFSSHASGFAQRPCPGWAPPARLRSDVDALDLVERDLPGQPVVELRGAGGFVSGDSGRHLQVPAVSQVLGDPGAAEAVRADLGGEPSLFRHVSPLGWNHIVLAGDYDWNSGAAQRTNVRPLNPYPAKIRA